MAGEGVLPYDLLLELGNPVANHQSVDVVPLVCSDSGIPLFLLLQDLAQRLPVLNHLAQT